MSVFRFKQFAVAHDRCAMKVGTDSILLGAWAEIVQVRSLLDIGCGSGLLALMLAQRLAQQGEDYHITALEIDSVAARQAAQNVRQSMWAPRIEVINHDLFDYVRQVKPHFDLIIANPPYFHSGVECRDSQRQTARYIAQQGHLAWLLAAQGMLNPRGKIAWVLPYDMARSLQQQLSKTALYCAKWVDVITKQGKAPQRVLLEFRLLPESAVKPQTERSEIMIYQADNQYHPDFINLTNAFYLKF
ncbi:methyltransferase [Testudinibacter sp. TR-2022]|uniref:tRNA1(Val) (adenine(37)-N6)-methyltransferase n=1 Tax=Testudinibacter sp. TR-2022 TaxID=2585029 RepID=UPI00111A61F8|nr:methyltransferase [Testudinibacter sp. TR-2022]TNH04855.1 methyltransferase [Pasteurellaceae bacterium Phil31]TNH08296.1 methyltransferase [Testudinibacter sp. TR-2022]TNH11173.1 methyltransferase [Testudinibacter sp. TR-2022]TNH11806.1 methyltransferase [Testudinibacter sp. TR-2022]TNH18336.1 methyltransferase [Testudinibacter sp. TR-2022]